MSKGKKQQKNNKSNRNSTNSTPQQSEKLPISQQEYQQKQKLYFAKTQRPIFNMSKADKAKLEQFFPETYYQELCKQVESLKYFDQQLNVPTFKVQQLISPEKVEFILQLATKMFTAQPNVLILDVPGVSVQKFKESLPKQYKDKLPAAMVESDSVECLQSQTPIELAQNVPNVPHQPHMIVVGDLHGTFESLMQITQREGEPSPENQFLLLGDYVDRGNFSVEVLITLLVWKLKSFDSVHMIRGNHESEQCTMNYSYREELNEKYGDDAEKLYKLSLQLFKSMPLAAKVNDKVFCVHGGISAWKGFDINMLQQVNRFRDPESQEKILTQQKSVEEIKKDLQAVINYNDPLSDILWSDCTEETQNFCINDARGAGLAYGEQAIHHFLKSTDIDLVIRAHQCVPNGYQLMHSNHTMTLFSVPNYNGSNLGAYCVFYGLYDQNMKIDQYDIKNGRDTPEKIYKFYRGNPLCFIRQFSCSDNSVIQNQLIIQKVKKSLDNYSVLCDFSLHSLNHIYQMGCDNSKYIEDNSVQQQFTEQVQQVQQDNIDHQIKTQHKIKQLESPVDSPLYRNKDLVTNYDVSVEESDSVNLQKPEFLCTSKMVLTEKELKQQASMFGNYSTDKLRKLYLECQKQFQIVNLQTIYKFLSQNKILTETQLDYVYKEFQIQNQSDTINLQFGEFCKQIRQY